MRLPFAQLGDPLFLVLATLTVALTSRITVRVPGVNGRITISETLIFLTMLLAFIALLALLRLSRIDKRAAYPH